MAKSTTLSRSIVADPLLRPLRNIRLGQMPGNFHNRPFDEGTVAKLRIFELYARCWLPVFLSAQRAPPSSIHIFDFFSGPGTNSLGQLGSQPRLLKQLRDYLQLPAYH